MRILQTAIAHTLYLTCLCITLNLTSTVFGGNKCQEFNYTVGLFQY